MKGATTTASTSSRPREAGGATPASPRAAAPAELPLPLLGDDLVVPLVTGERVRYVNLDCAASAPCLRSVHEAVTALLPWYSSVHRGAGFASAVMTEAYDEAREVVAELVGARADDAVVFTRNTTDSLNLLAAALPDDTTVVSFASEHHANLLPWRRGASVLLPVPASPEEALARVDAALAAATSRHRLLAVTGASNVTGELWPLAELAAVARRHGARIAIDAAQLAPHRPIDVAALDADYLALSAHKLYAPFGTGVLVGRADWLDAAEPYLAGGGAVRRVTIDRTEWARGEARHEAGTPNVLGAIALAAACRTLAGVGMDAIATHEALLLRRASTGLARVPGLEILSMWGPSSARVGIVAFTVDGWHPSALAAALSAEHGIGVRDGAFCAHPFVASLVGGGLDGESPGAVRASFGVGTSADDVDRLLGAVDELVARGPRWSYRFAGGRWQPDPDPRARPRFDGGRASASLVGERAPRAGAEPCRA
ncbi:MAG: aminotransferase class V-fold PLP-dependent enzyme [Labilithrix sp.]|nr:aminotransferase class V-fold PLP-dependent enzyme [Labilithrix sp.]